MLAGWNANQVLQLAIDPSVLGITADLTDFPLLVNLGSAVGRNGFDASAVFSALEITGDDFTGADNDPPNADIWGLFISAEGTAAIQADALVMTITAAGADQRNSIRSLFRLTGDFDIEVAVAALTTDAANSLGFQLDLSTATNDFAYVNMGYDTGAKFMTNASVDGTNLGPYTAAARVNSTGKLRWVRTGADLAAYYQDGAGGWTLLQTFANWSTDDVQVYLAEWCTAGHSLSATVDNFKVTSGTLAWPDGFPRRKKIAVADAANQQTNVEIERWDSANQTAQLWVRVPVLSAAWPTVFYFYFDATQADNIAYVGDTGETAAQAVWDADFAAVYHLSQDPSAGAGSILDSTSTANHGNPNGAMTAADVVAAPVGKALDFDGVDDYIECPASAALDITDLLTVEIALDPAVLINSASSYIGLASRQAASEDTYGLFISSGDGHLHLGSQGGNIKSTQASWAAGTFYQVAATYKATGLVGGMFINGAVEPLSNNALDTMAGAPTAPLHIGSEHMDTGGWWFSGRLREVRISHAVRPADYFKAAALGNLDNLITYSVQLPNPVGLCLAPYQLVREPEIAASDQSYVLADSLNQAGACEQPWGLKLGLSHGQPYGNAPAPRAALIQWYEDGFPVLRAVAQGYGDAIRTVARSEQPWQIPGLPLAAVAQPFSIAADPALAAVGQQYDLRQYDRARAVAAQGYSILEGGAMAQTFAIQAAAGGQAIEPHSIQIAGSLSRYCLQCDVQLARAEDYRRCAYLADLTVIVNGLEFVFFIEGRGRSRQDGQSVYTVRGLSRTALLAAPYARPLLKSWPATTAKAAAEELCGAEGIALDWQLPDWPIPASELFANNETPLQVIQKLARSAGGILQTDPDGTLRVIPSYPVSPAVWDTAAPDYLLSDEDDFFTAGEQYEVRDGTNRVLVSDQLTTGDRLILESKETSGTEKVVRAYQTPWSGGLSLRTSGGNWVRVFDDGVKTETLTETVEFVAGVGQTAKPIYGLDSLSWQQTQLGAVTYSEDGSLQAEVAGQSLLSISYTTKFHQWTVQDANIEAVQFYAEKAP